MGAGANAHPLGTVVRRGDRYGRDERSTMPASPACRYRSAHRFAVGHDTS
jgi:hypothetical protein